jgi:hypothetical protein
MPLSGGSGQPVTVIASGFQPGEVVTVTWDQGKAKKQKKKNKKKGKRKKGKKGGKNRRRIIMIGTTTIGGDGRGTLTFTVPGRAGSGPHPVEGIGSSGIRATVSFEVTSGSAREKSGPRGRGKNRKRSPAQSSPDGAAVLPTNGEIAKAPPPKRKPGKARDKGGKEKGKKKGTRGKKQGKTGKRRR